MHSIGIYRLGIRLGPFLRSIFKVFLLLIAAGWQSSEPRKEGRGCAEGNLYEIARPRCACAFAVFGFPSLPMLYFYALFPVKISQPNGAWLDCIHVLRKSFPWGFFLSGCWLRYAIGETKKEAFLSEQFPSLSLWLSFFFSPFFSLARR